MTEPLEALETVRRRLETIRHQLGSMSDYLDRGCPTAEEAQKTQVAMAQQKATATELEAQLAAMVQSARLNQSPVIDQWVNRYQAIFQELNAYFESHQEEDAYGYRLERHVTAQAITEWEKVRSGELDFVINNGYIMDKGLCWQLWTSVLKTGLNRAKSDTFSLPFDSILNHQKWSSNHHVFYYLECL